MDPITSQGLIYFFNNIDIFLLIFVRLIGFMIIFPVFTTKGIPNTVKILFNIFFTLIIYTSGIIDTVYYYDSVIFYALLVMQEFLVGFILAFCVYTVFAVIYFAGQLIDQAVGFSMISVLDPVSQIQVSIVGNLYYFVISVLFVLTGGLDTFIAGIFYSYDIVPIGTAFIVGNGVLISFLIDMMTQYFILGVQIALPIVGTIIIIDIILGILVKAVPQMNVFVVGVPIKILVGVFLLYITAPLLIGVYQMIFDYAISIFNAVLRSMMTI